MANFTNNVKNHIFMSATVGIFGGAVFGQIDGTLNLLHYIPHSLSYIHILSFLAFSVIIYSLLSCLIMTALCFVVQFGQFLFYRQLKNRHDLGLYAGLFLFVALLLFLFFTKSILASTSLQRRIIDSLVVVLPAGLFTAIFTGLGISYLNKKNQNKKLCLITSLFLCFWTVLLANGVMLVSLNQHLLSGFSSSLRIIMQCIVILSSIAILIVLFYTLSRLWQMKALSLNKMVAILLLNCLLLPVLEWGIKTSHLRKLRAPMHSSISSQDHDKTSLRTNLPNILWIVMDTVRADHLSCYGYKHVTSPTIDKIAQEGLMFEKAFSTAPWTLPSHASMFTGMYPTTHQTTNSHQYLSNSFTTIAELLRSYGYRTAGFSNNPYVSVATNLNQGFDVFYEGFQAWEINPWSCLLPVSFFINILDIKNEATEQVRGWRSARQTNEQINLWFKKNWDPQTPFFIFINYMEAHLPYTAPEQYVQPFLPDNISYETARKVNQNHLKYYAGVVKMDKTDFRLLSALYDGQIRFLDHYIEELFKNLRDLRIFDNTIIIITSDHGENLGENNKMAHVFSVDDRLLHVPLIIRYPQKIPAGKTVAKNVQLTQIFPTILDIIGLDWDERNSIQSESLLQEGTANEAASSFAVAELDIHYEGIQQIIYYNRNCFVDKYARSYKTIRDQSYKYIISSDGAEELFDINNDPLETKNLIGQFPDKTDKLRKKLNELFNSFVVPELKVIETEKTIKIDEKTLQGLRQLGYIQ